MTDKTEDVELPELPELPFALGHTEALGWELGHRRAQLLAALRESRELKQHAPRWIEQANGRTHWEGCWMDHRDCALRRMADLQAELASARKRIEELEQSK